MKTMPYNYFIISVLALFLVTSSAKASEDSGEKFDATSMIIHHIKDAHDWHLFDTKNADGTTHAVSIPLPIILLTEGNLDVFLSSEFHHGQHEVVKGDRIYKIEHEHILETSGKKVLDFSITKNVTSMFLSAILLLVIFASVASAYKRQPNAAPSGFQNFFETLIVFVRDDVAIPNLGEKNYKKYFPYLLTLFFFIWFNNLLGLLPTGANMSGNIAFTMTLAVITLIVTNVSGNGHYWSHIFWTPGVPLPLRIIILPLEVIGIFTKPFALMIRLFANITAGHIIILSLASFIFIFKSFAVGIPVSAFMFVMTCLELFVAILQAYIFTLLTALFIGLATEEPEHGHGHEAHH